MLELVSQVHLHDLRGHLNLEFPFHLGKEKNSVELMFWVNLSLKQHYNSEFRKLIQSRSCFQSSTQETPTNKVKIYTLQIRKLYNNVPCGLSYCLANMGSIKNYFPVLTRIKFTQFYKKHKHLLKAVLAQQIKQYLRFTENLRYKTSINLLLNLHYSNSDSFSGCQPHHLFWLSYPVLSHVSKMYLPEIKIS